MAKTRFVYVTYIRSTPEKVWDAIVTPAVTERYWAQHHNISDWKPGSTWSHVRVDAPGVVDIVGTVLESVPPRRLVVSWAAPKDADVRSKHSTVTFEIAKAGDCVCLTVVHDELDEGSEMCAGVTQGWPMVLSSLKSLLETGDGLPWVARSCERS